MAHGRLRLSNAGTDRLNEVMATLEVDEKSRPEVLRLAFARGLAAKETSLVQVKRDSKGFEVPEGVIARDKEHIFFSHLIAERLERPVSEEELDGWYLHFLEEGLARLVEDAKRVGPMDRFPLYLWDLAHGRVRETASAQ